MGPHSVGRGLDYLNNLPHTDNRSHAIEFCFEYKFKHLNSLSDLPDKCKHTFRELGVPPGADPSPSTHAELGRVFASLVAALLVTKITSEVVDTDADEKGRIALKR